ncbi:hypothetical protein Y032_0071g576 [Ancylostoma ceylanicum]|uniref:Uncharacterized protein n=1 Tax=Ancylostoma ceylanicum TaxID=53326 RepID=A0A016TW61_9BILA|nr:hypothetical protein Y032_0071g576 [Ancylostoma ceylanicum]
MLLRDLCYHSSRQGCPPRACCSDDMARAPEEWKILAVYVSHKYMRCASLPQKASTRRENVGNILSKRGRHS